MIELVIASANKHKCKEIKEMLAIDGLRIRSLDEVAQDVPDVVEDGAAFSENAEKKAREIADALGVLALADDSGLCVDALGGAPGIFSARFAGEQKSDADNRRKILDLMEDKYNRSAKFVCAMSVALPGGEILKTVEGECHGMLTTAEKGEGGFGYDSLFYYPDFNKTFAEVGEDEKNSVSHRKDALRKIKPVIDEYVQGEGSE